jgi:hypothetical protein
MRKVFGNKDQDKSEFCKVTVILPFSIDPPMAARGKELFSL